MVRYISLNATLPSTFNLSEGFHNLEKKSIKSIKSYKYENVS